MQLVQLCVGQRHARPGLIATDQDISSEAELDEEATVCWAITVPSVNTYTRKYMCTHIHLVTCLHLSHSLYTLTDYSVTTPLATVGVLAQLTT